MKILVLNCGSSSLKYQLINMDTKSILAKGNYERIGEDEAFLTHKVNREKDYYKQRCKITWRSFKRNFGPIIKQ